MGVSMNLSSFQVPPLSTCGNGLHHTHMCAHAHTFIDVQWMLKWPDQSILSLKLCTNSWNQKGTPYSFIEISSLTLMFHPVPEGVVDLLELPSFYFFIIWQRCLCFQVSIRSVWIRILRTWVLGILSSKNIRCIGKAIFGALKLLLMILID